MPAETRDHLEFLCDVGELCGMVSQSESVDALLQRMAELVARHLRAHVCSIYINEEKTQSLVLRANVGFTPTAQGKIVLAHGEGLVGEVMRSRRPLLDHHASQNPLYRFFPELGEERYDSFLAVPLLMGSENIGVLVVQREEQNHFTRDDLSALRVVASQLVACIENARALMILDSKLEANAMPTHGSPSLVHGTVVSPGNAVGPARVIAAESSLASMLQQVSDTLSISQFRNAVDATAHEIEDLQLRLAHRLPEAVSLIFSAHLLMLKDDGFVAAIVRGMRSGKPAASALQDVVSHYVNVFAASNSAHIQEKVQDVEDVGMRLARQLAGCTRPDSTSTSQDVIIASSLYPSDLVMLSLEEPAGVVLVGGGATSHVSILARSLQLPLFITQDVSLLKVASGTQIVLDSEHGNIYVAPHDGIVRDFQERCQVAKRSIRAFGGRRPVAESADGVTVRLHANVNLLSEVSVASDVNADGIGLYRTEFPFMIRPDFPDEEEQYLVYRRLVQGLPGKPITFRTLDVGGDKTLSYYDHSGEQNPALGLRAIRLSLRHRDIFAEQLRAILRAGSDCKTLRIMFPMISSLDEFRLARSILEECIADLQRLDVAYNATPQVGMMVELPSVLELAQEFAQEVDFFSIGSNDFVQYMLAVDRGNESMLEDYRPHHPAVLRALARFVQTAIEHGRSVSICGEMAQQPKYVPFLLGIGLRDFSISPHHIANLHQCIGNTNLADACQHAEELLAKSSISSIEALLDDASTDSSSTTCNDPSEAIAP